LMDAMLGNFYWGDNLDFAGRHDNPRLRGPLTAPNLVGKCWIGNNGSLLNRVNNTLRWNG
jgi:hypothetical protein